MSTAIGSGVSTGVFGGGIPTAAPIPASWNCITPGNCLDPGDGTGTYSTLAACETACPAPPPLLLNTYPGAAAAYSLRLLDNTYTGSAIRVRRSSDSTEQDIGFSSGELDTATLLTFAGAGDAFVSTWYDQSGNANNAIQASTGSQPQIVSSGAVILENGKPTVKFDGVNDTLVSGSTYTPTASMAQVLVVKGLESSTDQIIGDNNDRKNGMGLRIQNGNFNYYNGIGTSHNSLTILSNSQQNQHFYGREASTSFYARLDGAEVSTTISTFSVTPLEIYLGARSGGSLALDGNMQEYVLYLTGQNANKTGIETNIDTFYSIPSPTPPPASGFKFSVDTTQSGGTNTNFLLPTRNTGAYNFVVDWGDGTTDTITSWNQVETTHDYGTSGIYTIECSGTFDKVVTGSSNRSKIIEVFNWGGSNLELAGSDFAFANNGNIISSATDSPGLTGTCYGLFFGSNINGGIGGWDMSNVTSCQYLCYVARSFNEDLSGWDVSSITNFDNAFNAAAMSTANYDALLIAWAPQTVNSLTFSIGVTKYTAGGAAAAARATLVSKGWTITDGGPI